MPRTSLLDFVLVRFPKNMIKRKNCTSILLLNENLQSSFDIKGRRRVSFVKEGEDL